jgi:hypothetical protein
MSALAGSVREAAAKTIANPTSRPLWFPLNQDATCRSDQYGWGGGWAWVMMKNTMTKML